ALEKFGKQIASVNVGQREPVRSWTFPPGKTYPDQWMEREAKVPALPPGVYLIRARGGGAEKRTWVAISAIALLAKRSRQELLVYAARARSGQPISSLRLTLTDAHGQRASGATDRQGLWRTPELSAGGNLWIFGQESGHPAFLLSGPPPGPEPFSIYTVT